jgi:diacylglycerol kinase (ATP)
MTAEAVLIVNPAAGHGRAGRAWPKLARELAAAGLSFAAVPTSKPGEASLLAARALRDGAATVVAVGGDGTANEVVNGFFAEGAGGPINPEARFGLIPAGTGGDLARALGLLGRTPAELAQILGSDGGARTIDLGRAHYVGRDGRPTDRYFLNGVDLGLGGEAVVAIEGQSRPVKALGGFVTYLVGAVQSIAQHQSHQVRYVVDGGTWRSARTDTIWVANAPFTGGGMKVAPHALLDDGLLDVLIVSAVSKRELLTRLLPGIYRGTHLQHPAVQHFRARQIQVETSERLLIQLDGEQPGQAPAELTVVPGTLWVAV